MKTMLVLSMGALLLAGTLSAQTPVPEWQAGVLLLMFLEKCSLFIPPFPFTIIIIFNL